MPTKMFPALQKNMNRHGALKKNIKKHYLDIKMNTILCQDIMQLICEFGWGVEKCKLSHC